MGTANSLYSNFVDAADSSNNIKNNKPTLAYLAALATTVIRIGESKFTALYPAAGDNAFSQKFNFLNPVDSDAAFRLTFHGGITHTSFGIVPDGSSGYADTYIIPSTHLSQNSGHLLFATNSSTTANAMEICSRNVGVGQVALGVKINGNFISGGWYDWNAPIADMPDSKGISMFIRPSSGLQNLYKGGNYLGAGGAGTNGTALTYAIKLFCGFGSSGFANFSNRIGNTISIGSSLTHAEAARLTHTIYYGLRSMGRL